MQRSRKTITMKRRNSTLSGRWLLQHRKERLPHRLFVGLQDLQLLAGLQRVAPFFYFVRCARCHIQAIIKLTVTGLDHCLVQIALGKITGEIVCRQSRRQGARLLHCGFATFPRWFDRDAIGPTRRDRAACEADGKANH
jgi:hypothetical protein